MDAIGAHMWALLEMMMIHTCGRCNLFYITSYGPWKHNMHYYDYHCMMMMGTWLLLKFQNI